MLLSSIDLGRTVFDSAEFATVHPSGSDCQSPYTTAYDYVNTLYAAYLQRPPDTGGLNYWAGQVCPQGRENVRHAFDQSTEFANLVASLASGAAPTTAPSNVWSARMDPMNATGGGGENPISRNFSASVGVLGLSGRAGMDLGLSVSLNSSVWTPSGPYVYFDEDYGSLSPGFRIGFPDIQGPYFNPLVNANAYMMISGSGARVELRQVGNSSYYVSADSSYLQLTGGGASLTLTASDGTTMSYSHINNEYRCMGIEDRNGNLITVARNQFGNITTITDTANRTLNFSYDSFDNLISITQQWNGGLHTWATFGWTGQNMSPGFPNSMQMVGVYNSEHVLELGSMSLDDGTNYVFNYTSFGQVSQITHFGPVDPGHQRGYITYEYDSPSATNDCPRLTYRTETEENWNSFVITQYGAAVAGSFMQYQSGYTSEQSVSGSYNQVNMPDGTKQRIWYRTTGFDRGLPRLVETFDSGGTLQRSSMTDWANDNGSPYPVNPHVVETNITDSQGNRARTSVTYPTTPVTLPNGTACFHAERCFRIQCRRLQLPAPHPHRLRLGRNQLPEPKHRRVGERQIC